MVNHPRRGSKKAVVSDLSSADTHEAHYAALRQSMDAAFTTASGPMFCTDASGLFGRFLDGLPGERETHNCTACRRFMKEFGGLVTIQPDGKTVPVFWQPDTVPEFYRDAVYALSASIRKARVTSPMLSKEPVWGIPVTGLWSHMSVIRPASAVFRHMTLTGKQAMAAKREDFRTVAAALAEFTPASLKEALRLLNAETLARSEKFIGPVKWLLDLHNSRDAVKGPARDNLLWQAIATAPEGYCHPKASVIGTLLDDIAAGMSFDQVKSRFNAKMHPLQYQRPQAAPSVGNIAAAEKLVELMGIGPSLARRFARIYEIEAIWRPLVETASPPAGVFGHLIPKGTDANSINLPTITMTWEKFRRTVLPSAKSVEAMVPGRGSFIAYLTAVNQDAPPILKWDREDCRNPVSHYVYHGGSTAVQWGLTSGWHPVTAVTLPPSSWGPTPMDFMDKSVTFILHGAVDLKDDSGNALFPETLKSELHAVRATIEAFSRTAKIEGRSEASACGLTMNVNGGLTVRCYTDGQWTSYHIDRWD
jgi:hypothetical protein